jgi:hypothetical protein
MVAKNNLLRRALKERSKELAEGVDTVLNGPTAVYFGTDPVSAAKVVSKFMEDHEQLNSSLPLSTTKSFRLLISKLFPSFPAANNSWLPSWLNSKLLLKPSSDSFPLLSKTLFMASKPSRLNYLLKSR